MIKVCEYCGKEYNSKRTNSKYCSVDCRNQNMNKKIKCFCSYCGQEFYRKPSDIKNRTNLYCSKECHYKDGREEIQCLACGKIFIAKKGANRKFCCKECRQSYLPRHQKTNREKIKCKNCGSFFEGVKSAQRVFCSVECFEDYQKNKSNYTIVKMRSKEKGKSNFYNNKLLWHPNLKVLEEYEAMREKVLCQCKEHNTIFKMNPVNILRGEIGCDECYGSNGENYIATYLDSKNVYYERQKTFDNCKYKQKLRFDFFVPNINTVIEYDGEQHFKPTTFGILSEEEAQKEYEKTCIRDHIKDTYCYDNNINLIRIPYYKKKDIPNIIDKIIC